MIGRGRGREGKTSPNKVKITKEMKASGLIKSQTGTFQKYTHGPPQLENNACVCVWEDIT
jgi:hypothetical protein